MMEVHDKDIDMTAHGSDYDMSSYRHDNRSFWSE